MNADKSWDVLIRNALFPDSQETQDIAIQDGRILEIGPTLEGSAAKVIDTKGGLVTPSFTEPHFHLDKCLSRDYFGSKNYDEAFSHAHQVKKNFTVANVEERASSALSLAIAQGMGKMRAQIDVDYATELISFEGVSRARERYKNSIDIQLVAFPQEGIVTDPKAPDLLRNAIDMGAEVIGGLPEFEHSEEDQRTHVRTVFDIAEEKDVLVDIHADYQDSPEFKTLEMMADETIVRGMQGRVVANHCNALAVYDDEEAKRVIDKLREAEIQVAVLPVENLQMLGGPKRTPYNRGCSRMKELLDAGINVASGSDNMYDIWFRFNRMDPIETGYITCLSGAMRTDEEVREVFEMITKRAERYMGIEQNHLCVGSIADLVIHSSSTLVDIFRNLPDRHRTHLKRGRIVGEVTGASWSTF